MVLVIRLSLPAVSDTVTSLSDWVAADAYVLFAVNLSIMVFRPVDVYCVVCEFSACFAARRTLGVTVMVKPL